MQQCLSHVSLYYSFSLALKYENDKNGRAMTGTLYSSVVAAGFQDDPKTTLEAYFAFRESKIGKRSLRTFR